MYEKFYKIWHLLGGRKFVGLVLATVLCFEGKLTGDMWIIAFAVYCGANVAQKTLLKEEGSKK